MRWSYGSARDGQRARCSIVDYFLARSVPALAAGLFSLSIGTHGALASDPANGLLLARSWCTACHLVEPGGIAPDAAPPFGSIALDPATTPERLRNWLAKPHPPMPDLKLSQDEENDILAYILSLKSQ